MALTLTSPAFTHLGDIPRVYTCEGDDISPPLAWSGVPEGTQSLALVVDDPDAPYPAAPKVTWVHWVLFNLAPETQGLDEGASAGDLPPGTGQGMNDWKRTGYGGPCPPIGKHRYVFKLYALSKTIDDLNLPTRAALESRMIGYTLDQAELIGLYEKEGA